MNSRVSKAVLLCEDQRHESFLIAYLKQCGVRSPGRVLTARVASKLRQGGNVGWVLDEFPKELRAIRKRHARSLLIVMVDADDGAVADRRRQLNERAQKADLEPLDNEDPVALLVPKRHVETWIRALLGERVNEEQDCKANKPPAKSELRQASDCLYQWVRLNAVPGPTCIPSLEAAFATLRMIESRLL
jgi:hypothetical protein